MQVLVFYTNSTPLKTKVNKLTMKTNKENFKNQYHAVWLARKLERKYKKLENSMRTSFSGIKFGRVKIIHRKILLQHFVGIQTFEIEEAARRRTQV